MSKPRDDLRQISGDLRMVAGVLVILGCLTCVGLFSNSTNGRIAGILGIPLLLLPGVWFALASFHVRGGSLPVVRWSLWLAAIQLTCIVLCVCVFLLLVALGSRLVGGRDMPIIMPVGLLAFFIPAEAALIFQLIRAAEVIRAHELARGFEIGHATLVEPGPPDIPVAQPLSGPPIAMPYVPDKPPQDHNNLSERPK